MKKGIHPQYRTVAFRDMSNGETFLIGSTMSGQDKVTIDGTEYPLINMEISSASHPFFTGQERMLDSQGRIEKFRKKFGADKVEGKTVRKSR